MTIRITDFWRLVIESQLLPAEECHRLGEQFGHVKGAAVQGNARTLAEWLISQNVISRYQSTILLGGRAGPFVYGDYKIYDRVEEGPLAGQFKAVHSIAGHPVVLKFFAGEAVSPNRWPSVCERLRKHAKINHPHWLRTFELVDLEEFKFAAVADIKGQSGAQRLTAGGRIPWQEACRIAYQVALALARANESGFVHGDVRPDNIVIEPSGRAVLWCDPAFVPAAIDTNAADDATTQRADYAAPELATGAAPGPLTDVYALGCTLYQMLSGEAPFAGGNVQMKMQRHANEAIQPLAPLGVPEPLGKAVAFMMAKNSSVRFQTASQAADQLGQLLDKSQRQPQVAPSPPSLAALEQFVKQKPKPTPVRPSSAPQPATQVTNVATPGAVVSAPIPVSPASPSGTGGTQAPVATATSVAAGTATSTSAPTKSSPVTGPSASERFKKKKPLSKNGPLLIMIGCGVAFLLTLGILAAGGVFTGDGNEVAQSDGQSDDGQQADGGVSDGSSSDGTEADSSESDGTSDGRAADGSPPTAGATERYNVVAIDDGSSLWAPPEVAEPVELAYVPSGARVYIITRPNELLASTHGRSTLKALGPDFQTARQQWERTAGVTLDEVEQLVIGIHPNNSQMPRFSHTVTLTKPLDMKVRWGNAAASGNVFNLAGHKAWIPPSGGGRVFVIGAPEEVDALVNSGIDKPRPQLDPYFTQLIRSSNSGQQFVAVFDPQFFHTDGRDMFRGQYEKLIEPLDWFFGDDTKALVSLNVDDDFYGELRLYSRLQKTPSDMRAEYGGRLDDLPNKLKRYTLSLNPPQYWKELWFNFPDMVNVVKSQTRRGIEGDEAVFNFALPGYAAPNLVAASELSIATSPGATFTGTANPPPTATAPKTIEELLAAKIDLGFPQQSLEFSMRDVVTAATDEYPSLPFEFQIKINGADLEKEGITRNQQIRDFSARDTSVEEILTQLVRKANPVTTVTSPAEEDQKLVWAIAPDPDDASKKVVLITTRVAAGQKNLALPAVFIPK